MSNITIIFNFVSAFAISAGTALIVVFVGGTPSKWQIAAALVAGVVVAFKDTRSLLKLPPVDSDNQPPKP